MDAPLPPRVARPVMFHRWEQVTFLHWACEPGAIQQLLPDGLEVEQAGGRAWVSLLPFVMEDVRPAGLPPAPWMSRFPETNLRTYVRGPDGQSGIWFLSLDAARLPAVLGARATYGLPYYWSRMAVERDGTQVRYRSRRRWPGPRGAHCLASIEVGDRYAGGELGHLDHFLTARYVLYTLIAGRLAFAHAEHRPWPLARARLLDLDQDLLRVAGLPAQEDPPLVHYAGGVAVRVGAWKLASAPRAPARHRRG